MELPFTIEQFLNVFKDYNEAIFPMQVIIYLLAIITLFFTVKKYSYTDRIISFILGFIWIWVGIVYHIVFFSSINFLAFIFGAIFIFQSLLFFIYGVVLNRLSFKITKNFYSIIGLVFIAYSMIIYPILGSYFGHDYPNSPWFGITPCPATIFTFGLLLLTERRVPFWLLIIPLLWSIIGFTAAIKLGVREDIGLLVAGGSGFILIMVHNRSLTR